MSFFFFGFKVWRLEERKVWGLGCRSEGPCHIANSVFLGGQEVPDFILPCLGCELLVGFRV